MHLAYATSPLNPWVTPVDESNLLRVFSDATHKHLCHVCIKIQLQKSLGSQGVCFHKYFMLLHYQNMIRVFYLPPQNKIFSFTFLNITIIYALFSENQILYTSLFTYPHSYVFCTGFLNICF